MARQWVDFKELKEQLDARHVLAHFNVSLKGNGPQLHGFCPLPGHKKHEGKPRSPSFSVNVDLKAFHCFGCGMSGNLLEFACLMQGRNPDDPAALRETALELRKPHTGEKREGKQERERKQGGAAKDMATPDAHEIVNAPLGFALTDIDRSHPYLRARGFSDETIEHFGLGLAKKGLMKDRIAIPIHNLAGDLVAYAGRVVDDSRISAECPRYLFPSDREKNGVRHVFRKSELLYNGHAVKALGRRGVILVESYTAVWWLHQAGFPNVVAVMGSSMAEAQATLLVRELQPTFVVILGDGDEAGKRMAASALSLLAPYVWMRWEVLSDNEQPTDLDAEALKARLGKLFGK